MRQGALRQIVRVKVDWDQKIYWKSWTFGFADVLKQKMFYLTSEMLRMLIVQRRGVLQHLKMLLFACGATNWDLCVLAIVICWISTKKAPTFFPSFFRLTSSFSRHFIDNQTYIVYECLPFSLSFGKLRNFIRIELLIDVSHERQDIPFIHVKKSDDPGVP